MKSRGKLSPMQAHFADAKGPLRPLLRKMLCFDKAEREAYLRSGRLEADLAAFKVASK